jgi:hypothetical protein
MLLPAAGLVSLGSMKVYHTKGAIVAQEVERVGW